MKFDIQARTKANKQVSTKTLRNHIAKVMTNHIGQTNAIKQGDLFREIYGDPSQYTDVEIYFLWERVKTVLHDLRKNTYCFVASHSVDKVQEYFVVKTEEDAKVYKNRQANIIRQAIQMAKKADTAVEHKYFEKLHGDISLPGVKAKVLIE